MSARLRTDEDVLAWARDLRVALADVGAVVEDLLRPHRKRELGHVEHERLYRQAKGKIDALLAATDELRAR